MSQLLGFKSKVKVFFDDVSIFTNGTYEDHFQVCAEALKMLQEAGFTVKPEKYAWATQHTKYLGYILLPDGISPILDKF